jgi:hypothetical protein
VLARIRRGDRVDHFETVRRRKDGSPVEISLTVWPIRDANGVIVGASKIARDITERRQVEAERVKLFAASEEQSRITNNHHQGPGMSTTCALRLQALNDGARISLWSVGGRSTSASRFGNYRSGFITDFRAQFPQAPSMRPKIAHREG